jgi:hypothetical protein
MAKQRTFGDLNPGSYFWSVNQFGIERRRVKYIDVNEDKVTMSMSYYIPAQRTNKVDRTIENPSEGIYWYIDKKDAQKKAIELKQKAIKKMEEELLMMYNQLDYMRKKYDM